LETALKEMMKKMSEPMKMLCEGEAQRCDHEAARVFARFRAMPEQRVDKLLSLV
jgi:hypothetical protein